MTKSRLSSSVSGKAPQLTARNGPPDVANSWQRASQYFFARARLAGEQHRGVM